MGYNTAITICNDNLSDLEKRPEVFVRIIREGLIDGAREWGVTVHPSSHADDTQLIAVGGNFSTKVHTTCFIPSHHLVDGQIALLESWARSLGYEVRKK